MGALASGVSGLKSHQTMLDVTGNNLANVNTTGFKRTRVRFQDLLYQDLRPAGNPARLGPPAVKRHHGVKSPCPITGAARSARAA